MNALIGSMIAVVFVIVAINVLMLLRRLRKENPRKKSEKVPEEEEAVLIRDMVIARSLEREQEDAERYIALRNRMFELYEQVRRDAENRP